jgi:uncharacterized protein
MERRGAIPVQHTATSNAAWDGPAMVARLSNDDGVDVYRRMFAWVDGAADADTKSAYKLPHHMVAAGGAVGAANVKACQSAIGVLNGGRGGATIPDGDRQGVYNHLAAHLKDAGLTPPELNSLRGDSRGPGGMERRYFPLTSVQVETRSGRPELIKGHSAVFNSLSENLGFFRERILPGAFAESIRQDDIVALFNHDPNYPLGATYDGRLGLQEDAVGLYMEVKPTDTSYSRDLVTNIKGGLVRKQSFGFQVLDDDWRTEDGMEIRELRKVRLFDVSPVVFPAYAATDVQVRRWVEEAGLEWEGLAPAMVRCFRGLELDRSERRLLDVAIDRVPILRGWAGVQARPRPEASDQSPQAQWLDVQRRRRKLASRLSGRQMSMNADDDPGSLAQAVDQSLDEALEEHQAGNEDQAWQLVVAAAASIDALLAALGCDDSDETDDNDQPSPAMSGAMG